ncbi:DNA repair protein RadC [Nitrosospira sp. Nsp18]|uniref:RadC family protein n=1 Tax=Nitrosospira sp. Nsp18 TaxID=1855334 RepID=UPI0008811170|nr:DNA repair protein RadC [Nitrosospira sp. Nsp18]
MSKSQGASASTIPTQTAREDRAIYRALKILENRLKVPGQAITRPQHACDYLRLLLANLEREVFVCMFLDAQNRVIETETLFYGTLTQTAVHPREIVKRCLHHNAAAVIFAHNHPSGVANPSPADMVLTCDLINTLKLIDVKVLDHFIIGGLNTMSFALRGILGHTALPEENEQQAPPPKPSRRKRKSTARPIAPTTSSASLCHSL